MIISQLKQEMKISQQILQAASSVCKPFTHSSLSCFVRLWLHLLVLQLSADPPKTWPCQNCLSLSNLSKLKIRIKAIFSSRHSQQAHTHRSPPNMTLYFIDGCGSIWLLKGTSKDNLYLIFVSPSEKLEELWIVQHLTWSVGVLFTRDYGYLTPKWHHVALCYQK